MHRKELNDLALRIVGKNFCDLSREEINELKLHPEFFPAAYGLSREEFKRLPMSPISSSASAGSTDGIELGLDKT